MIRRPPRSTQSRSSAASDVYKRQPSVLSQDGKHWSQNWAEFFQKATWRVPHATQRAMPSEYIPASLRSAIMGSCQGAPIRASVVAAFSAENVVDGAAQSISFEI